MNQAVVLRVAEIPVAARGEQPQDDVPPARAQALRVRAVQRALHGAEEPARAPHHPSQGDDQWVGSGSSTQDLCS